MPTATQTVLSSGGMKLSAERRSVTVFGLTDAVCASTIVRMTGLGRATINRLMAEDKFPLPVRLAKRVVAWRHIDLEQPR